MQKHTRDDERRIMNRLATVYLLIIKLKLE